MNVDAHGHAQSSKDTTELSELATLWLSLPDHTKQTILTVARASRQTRWSMASSNSSFTHRPGTTSTPG
jgi:hypothetical protein